MGYRKITKKDAESLKKGDVVLIYPNNGMIVDTFNEKDIENISPTIVESVVYENVDLSFGFPIEGFPLGLYNVKVGTLHKKQHELVEQGRYWIKVDDVNL